MGFASAAQVRDFEVDVETTESSTLEDWQEHLCSLSDEHIQGYSVVVLSLFPSDEGGVLEYQTSEQVDEAWRSFCEALQLMSFLLRGKMCDGARLVLTSPRPHVGYGELHAQW